MEPQYNNTFVLRAIGVIPKTETLFSLSLRRLGRFASTMEEHQSKKPDFSFYKPYCNKFLETVLLRTLSSRAEIRLKSRLVFYPIRNWKSDEFYYQQGKQTSNLICNMGAPGPHKPPSNPAGRLTSGVFYRRCNL